MIAATNYQQHRSAQCRGGRSPVAASRTAHTSAARDKAQNRPATFSRSGWASSRVTLGRGLGSGHLSRGWACTPDDLASFRTRIAAGLTPEQAGAIQALSDHREAVPAVPRKVDHQSDASRVPVFDDQDTSERPNGTILYRRGEIHSVNGASQHECC